MDYNKVKFWLCANDNYGKIRNKYQLKVILNCHKYHIGAEVLYLIFRLKLPEHGNQRNTKARFHHSSFDTSLTFSVDSKAVRPLGLINHGVLCIPVHSHAAVHSGPGTLHWLRTCSCLVWRRAWTENPTDLPESESVFSTQTHWTCWNAVLFSRSLSRTFTFFFFSLFRLKMFTSPLL